MHPKDALGRAGEQLAAARLLQLGYRILDRNWRCEVGELDIVARDGDVLVVCEVKTRRSVRYGSPLDAVGPRKLRRMRELSLCWLDAHELYVPIVRFDVVGILLPRSGAPIITHRKGVG